MFDLQSPCLPSGGAAFRGRLYTVSVSPQKNAALEAPAGPTLPAGGARVAEHLVLLAHDESLIEALVSVVPGESLTVVSDAAALANHLIGGHVGVVLIDAGAAHSPGATAQLTQRLHNQLPDVVLVVAGDGAAQSELAAQVADGTIYRFVHKPVSAQRVKLFVDAAWRKRDGSGASGVYPALSMSPPPPPAALARGFPWPAVLAGTLVVGAAVAWFVLRANSHAGYESHPQATAPGAAPQLPPAANPALASATSDLDRLATAAEQALLAGDLAEASRLTDAARAVDPAHVRVKFLAAQIAGEQARAAARRRPAAQVAAVTADAASQSPGPAATAIAASAPEPMPVVAASAPATSDATIVEAPASSGPPSSTPPVSEARDPNSVAAVILQRVYSVDPEFPEIARERDLTGFVDLEFTVHADGTVTDVNVLKAQPRGVFEKAAVDAVSKWRYRPIERDGLPINEHARLRLNFAYK
jgi:TonB family protein